MNIAVLTIPDTDNMIARNILEDANADKMIPDDIMNAPNTNMNRGLLYRWQIAAAIGTVNMIMKQLICDQIDTGIPVENNHTKRN